MTKLFAGAMALALLVGSAASAQPYGNPHPPYNAGGPRGDGPGAHQSGPGGGYIRHNDWQRGHRMARDDWGRGQRVDWRSHRLRHPPRGYEWREVDGQYVLAAAATGLIASIIAAGR
jgi:Ni/Co efflux regulator RcnB